MEELPELKSGGVSFNRNCENPCLSKVSKHSTLENKSLSSSIYNQHNAMEFLCRSWTPSASDFQQMFSSPNLLMPLNANERMEEHEEERKVEETLENLALNTKYTTAKVDKTWMEFSHMKGWLRGKSLTNFFRSQREKKKEEVRLHTAKLHAALSLTQLAAAITSFATHRNSSTEAQDHINYMISSNGVSATLLERDHEMGVVVASAAALLTTVCAEAAESLGAKRARVASAVKSGLATQTPIDIITITATAATCLRGAATLESRARARAGADTYLPRNQDLLKEGVQTLIIMPSGEKEHKLVSVHLKQRQLTLSIRKKYLGGALTASKQYKIINVMEEIRDNKCSNFLSLKTNKGIIKLLFDDEKQSIIFVSTISNLLQMHNSC